MKRFSTLAVLGLASFLLLLAGCSKDTVPTNAYEPLTPEQQEIQAYLETSEYALPAEFHSDEQYEDLGVLADGGTAVLGTQSQEDGVDILPWVRFFRIAKMRPQVQYVIQIPGADGEGTADVRITHHIVGMFVVDNTQDHIINPFYRPLAAVAIRNLMLRHTPDGWRVEKISPADIVSTNDGGTTIRIAGVRTRGSTMTFPGTDLTSPDTLLSLSELPRFTPGDTIQVMARALSRSEDGCWLFLHVHSAAHGPHPHVLHWRIPFVRDSSDPTLFYARLPLPVGTTHPRVIHMAVDGIGWNTLFGDESAVYDSRMWAIPCVVGYPQVVTR